MLLQTALLRTDKKGVKLEAARSKLSLPNERPEDDVQTESCAPPTDSVRLGRFIKSCKDTEDFLPQVNESQNYFSPVSFFFFF